MREYELIYLIQPDATPERQKEIHGRVDEIVAQQSGILLLRDDWGKRKLAYEIDKFQKAEYVLLSYLGEGKIVGEIERSLRLDPDILRFLTVKVSDEVKDIDTRITEARAEEAERSKRREERERLEAERTAARQAALAAEGEARTADAGGEASSDSADPSDSSPSLRPWPKLDGAMLDNGVRVPAGTSRRIACDASRVVMRHDSDGSVVERPPDGGGYRPGSSADIEHRAVGIMRHDHTARITGDAPRRSRGNAYAVLDHGTVQLRPRPQRGRRIRGIRGIRGCRECHRIR